MRLSFIAAAFVFALQFSANTLGKVPTEPAVSKQNVSFTENRGQVYDENIKARPDVLFTGETNGMNYHLRKTGISYQLTRVNSWKEETVKGKQIKVPNECTIYRVDLNWPGCNENAVMQAEAEQAGYENYFRSVCPNGVYNVKTFGGVTYKAVYPGIDLHYYEKNGALKYDYLLAAGVDCKQIKIEVKGASSITITKKGEVEIVTPLGKISEHAPVVIQDGKVLSSSWILQGETLSFDVKGINPNRPYIIDPAVRVWGTYYGNSSDEKSWGCVTDAAGNVYMAGEAATGGLATSGAHQQFLNGSRDGILVKFNSNGLRKWATYYGTVQSPGGPATRAYACTTDRSGNVYITGTAPASGSTQIATVGSHQPALNPGSLFDAYLAKFDSTGVRVWGTYYGGEAHDTGEALSTDALGNVYLVGYTSSTVGISTTGSYQPALVGTTNAFVAKFNSAGVRLWGTYYGSGASAQSCAVDPAGNLIIAGHASSTGVLNMGSPGCHQPNPGGNGEAWVAKFNSSGIRLWGTYYGGPGFEQCFSCAVDCSGNVFISGHTDTSVPTTTNVLATPNAFQTTGAGGNDGFLAKFNSAGVRQWATLYGTNLSENQYGCATDVEGNVYVAGYLFGSVPLTGNGLATAGVHQNFIPGSTSCYLGKFSPGGQNLWGTYYGFDGTSDSGGAFACTTHSSGSVYLTGQAPNPFMPGTFTLVASPGSYQPNSGSPWNQSGYYYDMFLVRFSESIITPTTIVAIASSNSSICLGGSATLTASGSSNYVWSPTGTGTTVVVSPSLNTTYVLSGDDACYPAVFTLSVAPLPTVLVNTNKPTICKGVSSTITASGAVSYSWQPSGTGTSIVVSPTVTSTYTVTGTGLNGCNNTATVSQVVNTCAGIDEQSFEKGILIYPNPAKNTLTLNCDRILIITICNQLGQLIYQSNSTTGINQLDISEFSTGIYFLSASDGKSCFNEKFVKED